MQKTDGSYRERLAPSLWALVATTLVAPMIALSFTPIDATLALVIGVAIGVVVIALLVGGSPVVRVDGTTLRAGRAHIDAAYLGDPSPLSGEEAREARGPGLQRSAWHLLRGGIPGVVVVPVNDADDPVRTWVISTRTPDRLAAAIRRARVLATA